MSTLYAIPSNTSTLKRVSSIGAYVKKTRKDRGLTQVRLAAEADVDRAYLSQIESGRVALPNADLRRRIAKALGVSHLDMLVAAGEIAREEIQESGASGVVDTPPEVEALIDDIRGMGWTEADLDFVRLMLTPGMRVAFTRLVRSVAALDADSPEPDLEVS